MVRKKLVRWPEVVGCLQRDETRSYALERFRSGGFSADSFGHKTEARVGLCEALVAAEDWLEMAHPRWEADRVGIRAIRRRIELEIWP